MSHDIQISFLSGVVEETNFLKFDYSTTSIISKLSVQIYGHRLHTVSFIHVCNYLHSFFIIFGQFTVLDAVFYRLFLKKKNCLFQMNVSFVLINRLSTILVNVGICVFAINVEPMMMYVLYVVQFQKHSNGVQKQKIIKNASQ